MASPVLSSKTCSHCGTSKPLEDFQPNPNGRYGRKSTCRDCNRAASRAWKRANRDKVRAAKTRYREQHKEALNAERRDPSYRSRANALLRASGQPRRDEPEKTQARALVARAILKGELVREFCRDCGATRVHAHHEDYAKPLEIIWLCARCHSALHREAVA